MNFCFALVEFLAEFDELHIGVTWENFDDFCYALLENSAEFDS